MNQRNLKRAALGFTLIEFIIVVALIVAGGILVFNRQQSARISSNVNAESGNIGAISGRIKNMFVSRPNYAGIGNSLLISAKAFPQNMVNDPATPATGVNNIWGGVVVVAAANVNSGTNNAYTITYNSVPQAECVDLTSGIESTFSVITVGGTSVKAFGGTLNQATVATQCAAGADNNTLVFTAL